MNSVVGNWIKTFEHNIILYEKNLPEGHDLILDNLKAFTKVIDENRLLVYGTYDLICCLTLSKNDELFETRYFKNSFSEIIYTNPINLEEWQNNKRYDFSVYIPHDPRLTLIPSETKHGIADILAFNKEKLEIKIKGELCCKVSTYTEVSSDNAVIPDIIAIDQQIQGGGEKMESNDNNKRGEDSQINKSHTEGRKNKQRTLDSILKDYAKEKEKSNNSQFINQVGTHLASQGDKEIILNKNRAKVISDNSQSLNKVTDRNKLNMSEEEYKKMKDRAKKNAKGG